MNLDPERINTQERFIESNVRKACKDFDLIQDDDNHIALALSGGKDSLTLLFILNAISGRGFPKFKITAIHVSGSPSCGAGISLNFLQKICDSLNVDFINVVGPHIPEEELSCYPCSRIRRTLIFDAAKNAGATTIAFGHHKDDVIDTAIMNMLHKATVESMNPSIYMYKYGIKIIRPLYYTKQREIIKFVKNRSLLRATCQCPVGQFSLRKKASDLRKDIDALFSKGSINIFNISKNVYLNSLNKKD